MAPQGKGQWTCTGEGGDYEHPDDPQQVDATGICLVCGMSQTDAKKAAGGSKTKVGSGGASTTAYGGGVGSYPPRAKGTSPVWVAAIAAGVIAVLGGSIWLLLRGEEPSTTSSPSPTTGSPAPSGSSPVPVPSPTQPGSNTQATIAKGASNPSLMSQGEKILFATPTNPNKTAGAKAFEQDQWDAAIAAYQTASQANAKDPEAKIYLNNAKARKAGKPLILAVVVPVSTDPDGAQEILRGTAQYQEEFNAKNANKPLEVAIVDSGNPALILGLANDLIAAAGVWGVLGHGGEGPNPQAIAAYQQANVAVVSPVNTQVEKVGQESLLKSLPANQQSLLQNYLSKVGITLAGYISQQQPSPKVALVFNSQSAYSNTLKGEIGKAIGQQSGQVVKEVDLAAATADGKGIVSEAKAAGATTLILANDRGKLSEAIAIATANTADGKALALVGGDQLFNPTLLLQGAQNVEGLVLAVPWSSQSNDKFAQQANKIWKGRVSWRTSTAYDATQALVTAIVQAADRPGVASLLAQGIKIPSTATGMNAFNEIPLVKVVPGTQFAPQGAKHTFEPIK